MHFNEEAMTPSSARSGLISLIQKYNIDIDACVSDYNHITYAGYVTLRKAKWKNIIGYEIYRVPATQGNNGGWVANITFRGHGHRDFMLGVPDSAPAKTRAEAERRIAVIAASLQNARRRNPADAEPPPMTVKIDGCHFSIRSEFMEQLRLNPQHALPLEVCIAELDAGGVLLRHREDAEFLNLPEGCRSQGVGEADLRRAMLALHITHSLALHGEWVYETERYRQAQFRPESWRRRMARMDPAGSA
ncbi:hypothetical protein [Constrictibacter sp. MBR-5]|jgi:hypothetical protein|uniref:hypothetical protein n=1 Tax=Constrictibacter sp. MBR-5 TaxID=3156467 RepID=UPI0033987482